MSSCSASGSGHHETVVPSDLPLSLPGAQQLPFVAAQLGSHSLRIMIARTDQQKCTGLMYVSELASGQGMLFVYDRDQRMSFWMKNTLIPLDLIMFSSDLAITEFIPGMLPGFGIAEYRLPHYVSQGPARYALELPGGSIAAMHLQIGDRLIIPLTLLRTE